MANPGDVKRWQQNLQAERDAIVLYEGLRAAMCCGRQYWRERRAGVGVNLGG